jgi:HD superfamily phosphodiesterase
MERHSLRCRYLAAEIAELRGWTINDELLTIAAILHDIGLYPAASRGGVYTADGAALAREMLGRHGWTAERIELCARAIDAHHDLRSQRASGPEVEALRLADRIELTGGLLSAGVSRARRREMAAAIPRDGLVSEILRELGRAARERPLSLPRIFLRPPG